MSCLWAGMDIIKVFNGLTICRGVNLCSKNPSQTFSVSLHTREETDFVYFWSSGEQNKQINITGETWKKIIEVNHKVDDQNKSNP